jgi:hypothetical protein
VAALVVGGALLLSREDDPTPASDGARSTGITSTTRSTTVTSTSTTAPSSSIAPPPPPTDSFRVARGGRAVVGTGGTLFTYTVVVAEGVRDDPAGSAAAVDATLADPRSWIGAADVRLQRVGAGASPAFHVRLATPDTVDAHCAPLKTAGIYSCRNGADVMLNSQRWLAGATPAQMTLADYRDYMVNHEVGHALGHGHESCPGAGDVAPVMLQQTKGLQGCRPNPYPYP